MDILSREQTLDRIAKRARFERVSLNELDLSGQHLAELHFAGSVLVNVSLTGADLSGASFTECSLALGSLAKAMLVGGRFHHTSFAKASLAEANCDGSSLVETVLVDCDLSGSTWTACRAETPFWGQCRGISVTFARATIAKGFFAAPTFEPRRFH